MPQCSLGTVGTTWPVNAGTLESSLQDPRRGDRFRRKRFEEFNADSSCTPTRMFSLDSTSATQDSIWIGGCRTATGVVTDDQATGSLVAKRPPKVTNGRIRNPKFRGNLGQCLTANMAFDDVLSRGER